MEENNDIFGEYVEPKAEEKAQLIQDLQDGSFHLSFSALSAFAVSPRAFIAYKLQEKKTTPAMVMGEAVHCKILEPDMFSQRFFVAPDVNGATKEGKAAWHKIYCDFVEDVPADEFKMKQADIVLAVKEATRVTVITKKAEDEAMFRARSLANNSAARWVLDQITETEMFLPDGFEISGIKFKGAIDGRGNGIICDIKNMPDASYQKAGNSIWSRRLHWQAFTYNSAYGFGHTCYILAVDGIGEVSVHAFSESHLMSAERQMKRYLIDFKRCIFESMFDPSIWDSSQEFWLKTDLNQFGINYL